MSKINQTIFKAYDIRGVYPDDLNEEVARQVGQAFIQYLAAKKVVVARDMRLSSPILCGYLIKGIIGQGADVLDIGQVATDIFYYACAEEKLPGVMVTASHNPGEYNGFKMVREMPFFIGGGMGMEEIQELVVKNEFSPTTVLGKIFIQDMMDGFVQKVLSIVETKKIKPLKVVIDASHGLAYVALEKIFQGLPLEIIKLNCEPDGNFPVHGPNPLLEENRVELEKRVASEQADLGFTWDADGDRFFVIDDQSQMVPGDFLTALLAREILKNSPGAKIVYDLRASQAVFDIVKTAGGQPLLNRVGHSYIKKRMLEEKAVFGGEITGHYYFKDFYFSDSGMVPALLVLLMASRGQKMSEILAPLREKYFISGEINSEVKNPLAKIEELAGIYKEGKVSWLDGVSLEFPAWHFNVRPSNTEPLLRLNLEAQTRELMEIKRDEVLKIIRS